MGLFNSSDRELSIQFYDDPKQTHQDSLVSVTYTFHTGGVDRVARDYMQYVAKVMYCLGAGRPASMLRAILSVAFTSGLSKSTDVMRGNDYSMKMVQPQSGFTKRCHAKLYPNRPPVTKFSYGGEDYYAPMSCLAFLQHVVDSLNETDLKEFSDTVQSGMGLF